jgi:hypothetical protein
VRDDLLRERDELVDDGVGDLAPPGDRQHAQLGVDERPQATSGHAQAGISYMGRVGSNLRPWD